MWNHGWDTGNSGEKTGEQRRGNRMERSAKNSFSATSDRIVARTQVLVQSFAPRPQLPLESVEFVVPCLPLPDVTQMRFVRFFLVDGGTYLKNAAA